MAAVSWDALSWAYAFLGNTLMEPMTQGSRAGLDVSFWDTFPDFGSDNIAEKLDECADFVAGLLSSYGEDAATRTSVEFARLFVGPPAPAAAPWESYYLTGSEVGGAADPAQDMKRLLDEVNIKLDPKEVPHLDHLGIELLYLSEICHRQQPESVGFIIEHPLSWIDKFTARVEAEAGEGFYLHILHVAKELLDFQRKEMARA
ncbi:MAG: TorD/DmsD family molecular chaperone [Eggerthellaceae bacterium]